MELVNNNQKLVTEKQRFVGANKMLEQKIKVERSEKMSIMNDIEQMELEDEPMGGMDPNQSIMSGMSQLSRLSMKYSQNRGG